MGWKKDKAERDWLDKVNANIDRENFVFGKYPIGSSFVFLCVEMRVMGYQRFVPAGCGPLDNCPGQSSAVLADYIDDHGVVRSKTFPLAYMESALNITQKKERLR